MDKIRAAIIYQIDAERGKQEKLWGSRYDDSNTPNDWSTIVGYYMAQAAMCSQRWTGVFPKNTVILNVQDYRKNLVKAAAVCIAAIEAIDRSVEAPGKRHYDDEGMTLVMRPIPEWGDHQPVTEFVNACKAGAFTDDDGTAYYATETEMSNVRVSCSTLATRGIGPMYSHVVWIAK